MALWGWWWWWIMHISVPMHLVAEEAKGDVGD